MAVVLLTGAVCLVAKYLVLTTVGTRKLDIYGVVCTDDLLQIEAKVKHRFGREKSVPRMPHWRQLRCGWLLTVVDFFIHPEEKSTS